MNVPTRVALVCLLNLGLVGLAVAGQLSARATGEEIRLRVEPVDPIDPFRGAYVALSYTDIDRGTTEEGRESGDAYVSLEQRGTVWKPTGVSTDRPADGTFLKCHDDGWQLSCGIESYFLPQDRAREMETAVNDGDAVAVVKVDSRGNAALVSVQTP